MPKTIKYIGTQQRWPELAITGKQSLWQPGQQEERSDAEAALLVATSLFDTVDVPVYQDPTTGALVGASQIIPAQSEASSGWSFASVASQAARRSSVLKRFSDQIGVTYANSGTSATPSIDSASPFGRPALKLVIPNGNTWAEVQLSGLGLASFDDHVVWRVWIEDYTGINQINVLAGTTGYGRYWQQNTLFNSSNTNRWNGEHACLTGPTRAASINTFVNGTDSLAETKIRITPVSGADRNVWIDAVVVPARGPGVVLLTYDDGFRSWIDYVHPDLRRNGLVGSFAFQSNLVGTNDTLYLNSGDIATLRAAGHEIAPHQVANTRFNDGTSGTQTASQYQTAYRTCLAALRGYVGGAASCDYHPYVQGGVNQSLIDTLRAEGLRVGRGVDNLRHNFHTAGLGRGIYSLKTAYMDSNGPDLATLIQAVDDCERYGSTLVLMGHDFSPGAVAASALWSTENHSALMDYIGSKLRANRIANMTAGAYGAAMYGAGLVERQYRLEIAA